MEPAVIAAIVAGSVSLLGLLVQVAIARQTRIAQREQAAFTAQMKLAMDLASDLRSLEYESESVRIRVWEAMSILDRLGAGTLQHGSDELNRLLSISKKLSTEAEVFLSAWAKVKYDISDELLDYLRRLRHDCRAPLVVISAVVERIEHESQSQNISVNHNRYCADLRTNFERLLPLLDQFGRGISVVRHSVQSPPDIAANQ